MPLEAEKCEKRFEQLFNNANDAIYYHILHGKFVEVNDVACQMLGYSREEFLSMSPLDIDTPRGKEKIAEIVETILDTGHEVFEGEHVTKEGKVIPVEISSRLLIEDGQHMILSFVRDITERKQAEKIIQKRNEELLRSSRELAILEERSRLAREMHDSTAQALCYLLSRYELLQTMLERKQYAEIAKYLEEMKRETDNAYVDIREFLLGIRESGVNSSNWLEELEQYIREFGKRWSVKTDFAAEAGVENIVDNHIVSQVTRIIQEALANVRKHAKASKVRVKAQCCESKLNLTVEDDGCGFDRAQVEKYCHGLQIMKERAQDVGGCLVIDSKLGIGTRVVLTCPLKYAGENQRDTES